MIKRLLLLCLIFGFAIAQVNAQVYNMTCPPSPQTINSCSGTFYDAGGSAANYPNNQNCVYTICSNSPGECLMLNFTTFNVNDIDIFGNVYDYMAVYDGPSIASPLLFYIYGGPFPAPFPVAAAGACLTFEFISDGSVRTAGWSAIINCQPCPIPTSPTQQDCNGAIPICQEQYYQPFSYVGNNGSDIIPATSCLLDGELNSSWYVFTPQTSGPLSFVLSPNFTNDDYDWAIYDISTNGCAGITSGSSPEISCNYSSNTATWAGQTGAFSGGPYFGTLNSQGAFGTAFNASPNVTAGNTYVIVVSNFSSTQGGYYLDLSASVANLFDNIAPIMESVNTVACGANTVTVNFSEPILCSTIQAADFTITGGPPTIVTAAVGVSCGGSGTYTQSVTLTVNPALAGGSFNINLVGSITDLCGNVATGILSFSLSTSSNAGSDVNLCGLTTNLNGNSPAPGSGVWTQVSSSTGGTTIFGSSSSFNSSVTVSQSGVYIYQWTVTNGACVVSDQVVITFGPPPVATFTYPTPICKNATNPLPTFTGGGVAGVFSSSPATLNFVSVSTGEINLATTPAGAYTITNTIAAAGGCPAVTATFPIVINTAPTLTISPLPISATSCFGVSGVTLTVPNTFPNFLWTPTGSAGFSVVANPAAATTYSVVGTAANGCTSSASILVNVSLPANAGTNGNITLCNNGSAVNLFSSLGGTPQASGTWSGPSVLTGGNAGTFTPGVNIAGVYTYTVTGTAPCPNATATVTVTQNVAPNAGTNASIALCSNSALVSLFSLLGGTPQAVGTWSGPSALPGGNLGNFNPAVHLSGIYTYTVIGTAPCVNATATVSVTVNPATNAGTGGIVTLCYTSPATNLFPTLGGLSQPIGTWSGPSVLGNAHLGTFTPSISTPGLYTYTVTGIAPCPSATTNVTVNVNPQQIVAISGSTTICAGSGTNINFVGTPNAIVTYNVNGGSNTVIVLDASGNATLPTGNLSTTTNYNLLVIQMPGPICAALVFGSAIVTVVPSPTATIAGNTTICAGNSTNITFAGTPNATVTYSVNGGANQSVLLDALGNAIVNTGVLNSNVSYDLVNVSLPGPPVCIQSIVGTAVVTVNPASFTGISYPGSPFCSNFVGNVNPVITGITGGTFSSNPIGLSISGAGVITPSSSSPGTYTVTYQVPASGGCPAYDVTQIVVIQALPSLPTLIPNPACSGLPLNFVAGGGSLYEFTLNGVAQGPPSNSNTITLGPLNAGDQVCVNSYPALPINFNGLITEAEWGTPLSISAGGPAASGFGAGNNLDAVYLKNSSGYFYGALAGNVVNGSNNRLLLFIDCQPGGFNNLGAWVARNNSPYFSVENLNNITFDAGFTPEYILAMNQAAGNSYFDLYNMVTNTNNYLGDGIASPWLGFVGNAIVGDYTKGFEFGFPMSALGNPAVSLKVFAMLVNNPGTQTIPNTTISNQFLTPCGPAELNYGNGLVNFSAALPNPILFPLNADCYSQTCVTVVNSVIPAFSFPLSLCSGAVAPTLPFISDNGVAGTWSPTTVNNTIGNSYTFTPSGSCAVPVTINIAVVPNPTLSPLYHD